MKKIIFIVLALAFIAGNSEAQYKAYRSGSAFVNRSLVDKTVNLNLDSTVWRPLRWKDENTGSMIYADSLFIYSRATQANAQDSLATYVCVDFAPQPDSTGLKINPWFYRITVDSLKARTRTNTEQNRQWRIAVARLTGVSGGLAGFGVFRVVLTSTLSPEPTAGKPYTIVGNGTGQGIPKAWVNYTLIGTGGK